MYCICCKKNNVIPFDSRQSQKIPADKLETEEDILWKKDKRNNLANVNNEMINNGIIQILLSYLTFWYIIYQPRFH